MSIINFFPPDSHPHVCVPYHIRLKQILSYLQNSQESGDLGSSWLQLHTYLCRDLSKLVKPCELCFLPIAGGSPPPPPPIPLNVINSKWDNEWKDRSGAMNSSKLGFTCVSDFFFNNAAQSGLKKVESPIHRCSLTLPRGLIEEKIDFCGWRRGFSLGERFDKSSLVFVFTRDNGIASF